MMTKQSKSEPVEPLEATRWDITPLLDLKPITEPSEPVESPISLLEMPWVTRLMIARSKTLVVQFSC